MYTSLKKANASYFGDKNNEIASNEKLKREENPLYWNEKSLNDYVVELWEDVFRCTWDREKIGISLCSGLESLENVHSHFTDVSNLMFSSYTYQAVYIAAHALMDIQLCTSQNTPFQNGSCTSIYDFQSWQVSRNCSFFNLKLAFSFANYLFRIRTKSLIFSQKFIEKIGILHFSPTQIYFNPFVIDS